MAGKNGGVREGAGRKKGGRNKATQEIKDLLDEHVDFAEIVGKLSELAMGVLVERDTMAGKVIYKEPPNIAASKILMEYQYGKAKESGSIDLNIVNIPTVNWVNGTSE